MARFLFVVPPLVGHVNPTLAVAAALQERGHDVAWVGHAGVVGRLLPEGATLLALPEDDPDGIVARTAGQGSTLRGLASIQFFVEQVQVPLARHMAPAVDAAVDAWAPDVLVVDQQALGGALVARRRGLRWATSATTTAELLDPLSAFPKVAAWRRDVLHRLQQEHGVAPVDEPGWSEQLVLVFSTDALVGARAAGWPAPWAFVGPAIGGRRPPVGFPWDVLDPQRPRVLVSLGTVNAERQQRFYDVVAEAMADAPWQTIVSVGAELLPAPPPGVVRVDRVPQLELLPHLHAVVTHGGHNTVCEALLHGLPLVVTPIRDDQPVVAQQVAAAGAGLRLSFGRLRAPELREAVARVLDEPGFREAAGRIATSFRAAGGAAAAAGRLEALLVA